MYNDYTHKGIVIFVMNKELEKIFKEDQHDRLYFNTTPSVISRRDRERRKKVKQFLGDGKVTTGKDYYNASMIFHHSSSIAHIKKANTLAKKSAELGYKKAKWLYAGTLDRLFIKQGKKQKFGTQYFKKSSLGKWYLYPVDLKTTNEERVSYNVLSLKEIKKMIEKMNQKE